MNDRPGSEQANQPADEAAFDDERLKSVAELGGQDLADQLIDLFLVHAPPKIAVILAGAAAGDLEVVHRQAHALKSSAGNVGAVRLQRIAAGIDDLAVRNDAAAMAPELARLQAAYDEAASYLKRRGHLR